MSRAWPPASQSQTSEGRDKQALVNTGARAASSLLEEIAPETLEALAAFASRFAVPTAVLGAILIPSPNDGGIEQGTLPDHPDIHYRLDGPSGMLVISTKGGDGTDVTIRAQNRHGIYVDIENGVRIGRTLQGNLLIDQDAVGNAIQTRNGAKPQASADASSDHKSEEPKLCPAPAPDTPHGSSEQALDYEEDVHARVNPLAPIPRGFAVMVNDPATGEKVHFDDCFRYTGDLVDGDMRRGDLVDAKGPRYAFLLLAGGAMAENVMQQLLVQAKKQTDVTLALGLGLKWYFAEEFAADAVRRRFAHEGFGDIVIGYMPPRKRR